MTVPNRFPPLPSNKRVALIGEAPGAEEERLGRPFVGVSGRFLAALLSRAGISIDACFLGNISQHRPPSNDFHTFGWNSLEVQHGLEKLREDIEAFNPCIVVLLGNVPLKAAKDPSTPLAKRFKFSNSNWRGSLFLCNEESSPFVNRKCIASYHPAYCLRDYEATPLLQFDLRKAVQQGTHPGLSLPQRELITDWTYAQIEQELRYIRTQRTLIALDIEGVIDNMSCISIATSPTKSFIINTYACPPTTWRELAALLEDPTVPKVLQNSLYDRFVLHYSYGICVRNVAHDTMLKHWELYSELEKSLGVQCSLYTDEPYYKGDRKSNDDKTFYEYCCRDSAVTLEISNKLDLLLNAPSSRKHYELNVALLNPLLYMELRGIRYDVEGAFKRRELLRTKLFEAQARLNSLAGFGFKFDSLQPILNHAEATFKTKKGDRVLKDKIESSDRFDALVLQTNPSLATIGEIENLCEVSLNVQSSKQFTTYLYETLQLPVQFTEKRGEDPRPTADYEALLKLSRELQKTNDSRLPIIRTAIEIRALGTRERMLGISADSDGRIRCGYNIVGSNTGRITCYESPTGSGYNLQTIPNYTDIKEAPGAVLGDRDLFLADDGYWFFQCDLSGADGWTVAAYSAMLGDSTMLDDYRAGISPFKILTLMLRGVAVSGDRNQLKEDVKQIDKDAWDRFAMKRVQHGGCYLEGALTISRNILKDSEGKLYMSVPECEKMKQYFFERYRGVKLWHDWVARRLKERPILQAASGQVRQFFGRPDEILTKAVAFEPQGNTTFATNLAMFNLWKDHENRTTNNKLLIKPLHQVHDALVGQFEKERTDWALPKIREYFNNTLQIAGQSIVIPFEGGYGPNWGDLKNKI